MRSPIGILWRSDRSAKDQARTPLYHSPVLKRIGFSFNKGI